MAGSLQALLDAPPETDHQSRLKPRVEAPVAGEPVSEELSVSAMDGRYSAIRPAGGPLTRMHIVLRNGDVETVQYHHSDVRGRFKGSSFEVEFVGSRHWRVTVKGSGPLFFAIYDYITLHRWPYLREAAGSLKEIGPDETVLSEIRIDEVTGGDRR